MNSNNVQGHDKSLDNVYGQIYSRGLQRVRQWYLRLTSEGGLMSWAALEAAIPLLPVEFVLIPLTRARPTSAFRFAMLATSFSAIGAIYSYALGHFGENLVHWDGVHAAGPWLDGLVSGLDHWGEGLVFLGAFFPTPLCIVAIGAGMLHLGLVPFVATVALSRAARFYLVTLMTVHFNQGKQDAGSGI